MNFMAYYIQKNIFDDGTTFLAKLIDCSSFFVRFSHYELKRGKTANNVTIKIYFGFRQDYIIKD